MLKKSENMLEYLRLEAKLKRLRQREFTDDEEDIILDLMDDMWWELTDAERNTLNNKRTNADD